MKRFLQFLSVMALILATGFAEAQTVISNESFPNSYNTGFARPVNSTFTGSTGTWAAFSTDANASIVCNNAYVQTTPNALKILNYNNSSLSTASTCRATSPTVNLGSLGCTNSVALSFKLYTYTLNVNNTCFSFFVEFSSDNGTNWSTVWTRTAQQLIQSFGSGTWTTQNIPIPSNFYNTTFKYRLRGTQAAGCAYDSYLYIDDVRVLSQPCLTICTTGFNPTANARGFNVFTQDGAKFINGHTDGGVAMGGDLTLQGATTIAMNSAFLTYPVTNDKFGLVVGGKMVYTSGGLTYVNNGKIRLGSTTNSRLFYRDCNNASTNFRVTPFNSTCATAYNTTPALQQQSTSPNSDPLDVTGINYSDDFMHLQRSSTVMSAYSTASSCSTALNIISISGNTPTVTIAANKTNVITVTGAQLAALTNITFSSAPTATNPLVINVNQTGSFNWTAPFNTTGLTNAAGQFIIFNFYNATGDINVTGSNIVRGTLFAPQAAINWSSSNNLEGQAIARYFTLNGGEIHYQRFSACVPDCIPANPPCVSNVSLAGGHTVSFQGVSYSTVSGNIKSTFTYSVTSGSSPNISHFVFGNFNCQSCFNDASDLYATSHTPVSMGTDPTTSVCGLKYDFSIASGQSTTVSFTLNGYYDIGPIVVATKAGTNTAFGYICGPICTPPPATSSLGNLVWIDADDDGIKDVSESGYAGATVRIYSDANSDGLPDGSALLTTVTNANGEYVFNNLANGNYIVGIQIPANYKISTGGVTSIATDNLNDAVNTVNGEGRTTTFTLNGSSNNIDFAINDLCAIPPANTACSPPVSFDYVTMASGNWTNPAVWMGGLVPPLQAINNKSVKITHNVTIATGNLELVNNTVIYITNGGSLTVANGTLLLTDGVQTSAERFIIDNGTLRTAANVQQSGSATFFCAKSASIEVGDENPTATPTVFTAGLFNNSTSSTSADFQNTDGYRRLEDVCLNVTHDLQNTNGQDIFIDVCAEIGDRGANSGPINTAGSFDGDDNGNIQVQSNSGSYMRIYNSEFYLPNGNIDNARRMLLCNNDFRLTNGNFSNQSSSSIEGTGNNIWINNAAQWTIINNGSWPASVISKWRTDNTITPIGFTGLVAESTLTNIASTFGDCGCAIYTPPTNCPVGTVSLGNLTDNFMVFTDANVDANWQGTSKGFVGDVVIDGIQANERTSGTVPYAGILSTNNSTLSAWQNIVDANAGQAFASLNQTSKVAALTADLESAFTQINSLPATTGYTAINAVTLNGLNTQNNIGETFVINVTTGFTISSQINITGDANDVFILRWDTDANFADGYEGQVRFQSGGAIVPLGALTAANFIHVAGDIGASGGGSNPPAPYPQGPRFNNGTGSLVSGGSNFSGGGFFTGYWLTTGTPTITGSGQPYGATSSLSNLIFVGGWYSKTNQFSITSGTSGVYVEPIACAASIGDFVWNDLDKDGIQDVGEPGLAGVTVTLTYPGGATTTTTTNNNGAYLFSNLLPGNYTVTFTTPDNYVASPANIGSNDNIDSDPVNGTVAVTIASGENKLTIDAGFYEALKLGNVVWNDTNGDGQYENDEPFISGVTVRLYNDANGDNIPDGAAIATTTTNAQGVYSFNGLAAGNYIVGIVIPTGYESSVTVVSSTNPNNNIDDDNNGINLTGPNVAGTEVRSNFITLSLNGEPIDDGDGSNGNLTLDFGLQGLGGIGDYVFNDIDKDGIQDANEDGIQNVNVTLTYPGGFQVTIQTDENGYYFFPNLGPGSYTVAFETPIGQLPSPANVGANDAIDSDPVAGVVNVTLNAGQVNTTIDAGYYIQICTPIVANCGTGFVRKTTTLVTNGNFSSTITSPSSGNSYTTSCVSSAATTAGITYNYSGGNFKAQAEYDGLNTRPGQRAFEIITAANLTTPFIDGSTINKLPFPGDAVNGVPSSLSWIYHRNDDIACERLLWEQTATGMVIGKTYTFRFYATNPRIDNQIDPIIKIETGGTTGLPNGTVQGSAVTLTEAITENSDPLNGWIRFSYTFTATTTSITFKIVDMANSNASGDEVGITAIGLDVCEKDTDGDCVVDVDDIDDDNDGILDIVESGGCDPLLDSDGDGIPNYKDSNAPGCQPWVDCNSDGINDNYDWDRDGIINELDLDSDNDGILDVQETRAANAVDNNYDGMVDGVDMDGDGLLSSADANDNVIGGPGLTPQDLDRDGAPNYLDLDSDGDGLTDITEALELYDTDGLTAGTDVDMDGVRAKGGLYTNVDDNADNYNGFGAKGIRLKDFDADGKPNPYDVDSDQDGITDNVEGQPTCSYEIPCTQDIDGDGVADCYDVNTSNCTSRTSGGITPYDKDGDSTPDIYDLDTDNDGAPDINEGSGREGGFVEDYSDADGDGLIGEFDNFNIVTALNNFTNNVAHGNMGPNGNLDGPIPSGSYAELPQSQPGSCPTVDRDWRNVTILPVTLMEFKGSLNNSVVNLQWKVTNEVNVDRYIIERSTNGTNFTGIAAVTATASTAAIKDYQQADNISSLNTTVVYYRLITEDKGGSKAYSNTIVFRLGKAKSTMAINPNPASNFFNVRIQSAKDGYATIRILDMTGRVVLTNNSKLFVGSNTIAFNNAQQLAAGTYSVQMLLDGEVFTEKLMIMH
jgi:choice-of-anchor A domain-containing protein